MTRRELIRNAYKVTGSQSGFYDGMITCSTFSGKMICRLVWNMDEEKNLSYLEKAMAGIPAGFSGQLLEVPVGTGVLTMPVYQNLRGAEITCLDYSADMMKAAEQRAEKLGLDHVRFQRGDVGNLPFLENLNQGMHTLLNLTFSNF